MKFELEQSLRGFTDTELLEELRRCAHLLGRDSITMDEFAKYGKGHATTFTRRFGSWTKALELAHLQPSRSKIGISAEELFVNLRNLWLTLNRQPRYREIKKPLSQFSAKTYENRFGSWTRALNAFIEWVNGESEEHTDNRHYDMSIDVTQPGNDKRVRRRTKRAISERQRFRILLNAGFRCSSCGASPLSSPGTELHVDHIIPWSKGGETIDDNLTCKCKRCNLGKGNAFES